MTYQELRELLWSLTPAQLKAEVRYQDTNTGEFRGIRGISTDGADYGLPDDNQPILEIVQ